MADFEDFEAPYDLDELILKPRGKHTKDELYYMLDVYANALNGMFNDFMDSSCRLLGFCSNCEFYRECREQRPADHWSFCNHKITGSYLNGEAWYKMPVFDWLVNRLFNWDISDIKDAAELATRYGIIIKGKSVDEDLPEVVVPAYDMFRAVSPDGEHTEDYRETSSDKPYYAAFEKLSDGVNYRYEIPVTSGLLKMLHAEVSEYQGKFKSEE